MQFLSKYPFSLSDLSEPLNSCLKQKTNLLPHSLGMNVVSKHIKQNSLLSFITKESVKPLKVAVLFSDSIIDFS